MSWAAPIAAAAAALLLSGCVSSPSEQLLAGKQEPADRPVGSWGVVPESTRLLHDSAEITVWAGSATHGGMCFIVIEPAVSDDASGHCNSSDDSPLSVQSRRPWLTYAPAHGDRRPADAAENAERIAPFVWLGDAPAAP